MITTMERITPEKAAEMLRLNVRNRHISRAKVLRFRRDIDAENWSTTHQSIGVAPSFIVDGQHRLTATKESGRTVTMNVTRYETDEEAERALQAIDLGDKRSDGDTLEISGIAKRGEGRLIASVAKRLCILGFGDGGGGATPTLSEIRTTVLGTKRDHIEWSVRALTSENKSRFTIPVRTAFAIAHMDDAPKTESFANGVIEVEAISGSLVQAWLKAETGGKFRTGKDQSIYAALRLLQCAILGEPPPKVLKPTVSIKDWFHNRMKSRADG